MSERERQLLIHEFYRRFDHAIVQRHKYRHRMGAEGLRLCNRSIFDAVVNLRALYGREGSI